MEQFTTYAGWILAIITLATAAGVGFQRGKIAQLRGELTEADARADRLASELSDTQTKLASTNTQLEALAKVVTGEAHWTAISHTLDEHHLKAEQHWTNEQQLLQRVVQLLEASAA